MSGREREEYPLEGLHNVSRVLNIARSNELHIFLASKRKSHTQERLLH